MLDIINIGNQKTNYPNCEDIQFESLDFYVKLARKTIAKFGNSMFSGIAKEMLSSEDTVANVANAIMMADWRWDPNRSGQTGEKKTRYSYRNQCAIWAIKSYISRKYKKLKNGKLDIFSIDATIEKDGSTSFKHLLESEEADPLSILLEKEKEVTITKCIEEIMKSSVLTEKQKAYLKYYYLEDMTLEAIGKKYGVTREAVRQGIQKACLILRGVCNV
jgi:RNA polymerase sigma factor (sigma-70 family)